MKVTKQSVNERDQLLRASAVSLSRRGARDGACVSAGQNESNSLLLLL